MTSQTFYLVLSAVVFAFAVAVPAWRTARAIREIRRIEATKLVAASAVRPGLVRVVGVARAISEVSSPISGTRCAAWHVAVTRSRASRGRGGSPRQPKPFHLATSKQRFAIEDESGRVLVDVASAPTIRLPQAEAWSGLAGVVGPTAYLALPQQAQRYLDKAVGDGIRGRRVVVREHVLVDGAPAFVVGTARRSQGGFVVGKDEPDEILVVGGDEASHLARLRWKRLREGAILAAGTIAWIFFFGPYLWARWAHGS